MRTSLRYRTRVPALLALIVASLVTASCNQPSTPTSTPIPTETPFVTATPTQTERMVTAVRQVFDAQLDAIQRGDWEAVYPHCSPGYRDLRTRERFVEDASAEFARDGFESDGFEARNIEVSVRSPDRVAVAFDAYQDGEFTRRLAVGQNYILVNGRWWDNGMWCKLRAGA